MRAATATLAIACLTSAVASPSGDLWHRKDLPAATVHGKGTGSYGPVKNLPGYGPVDGVQHAGYLELDASTNSNMYYWFFESQSQPASVSVIGTAACRLGLNLIRIRL